MLHCHILTCDLYDWVANPETLDGVARQTFDRASPIREKIDYKIANDVPLEFIPELWQHEASYAFTLLHSSANEGQHRTLKCEARVAIGNCLPATLNARSNKDGFLEEASREEFCLFASMMWSRRRDAQVTSCLLKSIVPQQRLARLDQRPRGIVRVWRRHVG